MHDNARQQFLTWVERQHPRIYNRLARDPWLMLSAGGPTTGRGQPPRRWIGGRRWGHQLGQAEDFIPGANAPPTPKPAPSWFDKIMSFATPLLQIRQQKTLFDLQLKRAKQGLPPLAVEQYAPAVRVKAGIDSSIMVPLVIAGVGVAAMIVLPRLLGKRGRRRG